MIPLSSPLQLSNLIHHDAVINDSEDEHILLGDDSGLRPREIESTLEQTFFDKEHYHDALKAFAIVKNIKLEYIKTKVEGLRQK